MAITIQNFLIYGQRCLPGTLLNLQKKNKITVTTLSHSKHGNNKT